MLIDTQRTVTYKCSFCGKILFIPISLFKLMKNNEAVSYCSCKQSMIKYARETQWSLVVESSCIGCGQTHIHYLNAKNILRNQITIINCPVTGIEQLFIGTDKCVKNAVDKYERRLNDIADSLGYDSYFENSMVMLQTINKIHEMAENHNLYCKCGSRDIDLILQSNRVQLRCKCCNAKKWIPASDNSDLRDILDKSVISLNHNKSNLLRTNNPIGK